MEKGQEKRRSMRKQTQKKQERKATKCGLKSDTGDGTKLRPCRRI
jgi:hypothetical protein